jgi:gluconolactonase
MTQLQDKEAMSRRTLVQALAAGAGAMVAGAGGAAAQTGAAAPPSTVTNPPRDFGPRGAWCGTSTTAR